MFCHSPHFITCDHVYPTYLGNLSKTPVDEEMNFFNSERHFTSRRHNITGWTSHPSWTAWALFEERHLWCSKLHDSRLWLSNTRLDISFRSSLYISYISEIVKGFYLIQCRSSIWEWSFCGTLILVTFDLVNYQSYWFDKQCKVEVFACICSCIWERSARSSAKSKSSNFAQDPLHNIPVSFYCFLH